MIKRIIIYTLIGSAVYSIICGIGWTWALGLEFDWWKLPIIGAVNYLLNIIGNSMMPKSKEKKDKA